MSEYKLVPLEPTDEMIAAARALHECDAILPVSFYKAMIVAAPKSEQAPVAWMTHHDNPMFFPTEREAAAYCDDDERPVPLYVHCHPVLDTGECARRALDEIGV